MKSIDSSKFHLLEPSYKKPVFQIPESRKEKMAKKLTFLYGKKEANRCILELIRIMQVYYAHKTSEMILWEKDFKPSERFTEKDAILISYGDLICEEGYNPLETDIELSQKYLRGVFNTLHILPFFPYSSDRGFAIMDFEEVDPKLGCWEDIIHLKKHFRLMFDSVVNHVSAKSRWFQEFLNQNPDYQNFFTVFSTKEKISEDHLKLLLRPRTSEVLTSFNTLNGKRLVWTTFSPDQIDLNFSNYKVLLKMVEILLTYVRRGADIIRLDAVTYLWDELGTTGAHLAQSHTIIKLFRDVLDAVAPHVALLTETNVLHKDNIKYFGDGNDEAQMVYNFALPPLVLHTFYNHDSLKLTDWAMGLENFSDSTTYFNFLDSHDGIGVMAVQDILSSDEIEKLSWKVLEHGGFISYKTNSDGSKSPYELNITWYSAINREDADESEDLQVKRYLASRSIALVLIGVPGVYLHGLLGSKNDAESVLEKKDTRSINRKVISKSELIRALEDPNTTTFKVSSQLVRMIRKRIREKAFHPNAEQKVINISKSFFVLLRTSINKMETILTITNITNQEQIFEFDSNKHNLAAKSWFELFYKQTIPSPSGMISLKVEPYGVMWLKATKK